MDIEEAIKIMDKMIKSYIEADECGLSNDDFKYEIEAMQTVLNMLKEKRYMKNKINKLEQKSNILDKITDKLKEDREIFDKCRKIHEMYSPSEERMNTKYHYTEKLLNIIEGERNDGEIIRSL